MSQKRADEIIDWLRYYGRERINSRLMDERRCIPPYIVLDFGNHGVLGLQVEERYGGAALLNRDFVRVLEQIGAIDINLGILVVMNNALGIRPIQRYAQAELREELLPILAAGRELASFSLTEPGAGSNPRAIASTATPHRLDNSWRLRGKKIWSGSSAWSGVINIFVKQLDSNHQPIGISGFAVRQETPGLRMGPEAMTMGLRGMVQNAIYLEDAKVSRQQLLGEAGGGMAVAQDAMMFTRLCLAAVSLGAMKRCVSLMLRYAERRQIATGRLLDNPLTRLRISEHTAAITAVEALVNGTAELLDSPAKTLRESNAGSPELLTACKIIAPELLWSSVDDLVQMLGGRGYLENNLAAQIFRDARVIRIFEGPTETLNMHLGSRAVERPSDLRVLLRDELEAADLADRLGEVAGEIAARHTNNSPFADEKVACNQRIYLLVGEIAAKTILLAVTRKAWKRQTTTRLQHAVDWCEQLLQETVEKSLETTAAERSLFDIKQLQNLSQDLAAQIGDIDQTMAGEESELDPLLRQELDPLPFLPSNGNSETSSIDRQTDLRFSIAQSWDLELDEKQSGESIDEKTLHTPNSNSPNQNLFASEFTNQENLTSDPLKSGRIPNQKLVDSSISSSHSGEKIENWLVQWLTRQLKIETHTLDLKKSFPALGVESVNASNLAMDLEEWLGLRVDIDLLWDYPDIPSLAGYLATKINREKPSYNRTFPNENGHKKDQKQEFTQVIIPNQNSPKSQIHPSKGFVEAEKIPQFFQAVTEQHGRKLLIEGRWVYDFASCNYLGLDLHPKVKAAILPAVEKWGTHPSWTRFVAWPAIYDELEEELGKLLGVSDLMVFPSLTLLQMGVIPMLVGNDGIIFSDIYAHRCIYEACRVAQHNGAKLIQYRHEDLSDLEEKLAKSPIEKTKIITIDGVYSLSADLADLPGYVRLAKKYNATIYVDDAHSFGILGENPTANKPYGYKGNGIVNHFGLRFAEDNIIYVAALSKAYSSYAAFITCPDREFKNKLRHVWTSGYSGPSPVASLATALAGLKVNHQEGEQLREKLYHLTRKLVTQARSIGFEVENHNYVPLFSVIIGEVANVVDVCQLLWEYNILITPAVFPAVPLNRSSLRFSITAANTEEEVDRAIEALAAAWDLLQKRSFRKA